MSMYSHALTIQSRIIKDKFPPWIKWFKEGTSLSRGPRRHYQTILTQSWRCSLWHYSPHIWRRYMLFQRATPCCPSGCCFDSSQEDVWAVELATLLIHACCLLPHCCSGRISASCSPTFRIEGWGLDFQLPVQCNSSATNPRMGMGMKATEVSAGTSLALSEHHVEHMCLQDGWGQKVCWVLLGFNHVCLSGPATCVSPLMLL